MKVLSDDKVKRLLLEMLIAFDETCSSHSIRYSLDSGTLLGAIRHKGFIPWDDDLDVIVPRPDYEKLLAHSEWLAPPYEMHLPLSEESPHPFAKMIDTRWRAQEPGLTGVVDEYLWLDIFPADAVPPDTMQAEVLCRRQVRRVRYGGRSMSGVEGLKKGSFKRAVKSLGLPIHRLLFSPQRLFKELDHDARAIEYGSTERVANITWPMVPKNRWIPAADFDALTKVEFEGHRFNAIPHWHEYLTGLYGDYMQLPPVEKRDTHGVKVWRAWSAPCSDTEVNNA